METAAVQISAVSLGHYMCGDPSIVKIKCYEHVRTEAKSMATFVSDCLLVIKICKWYIWQILCVR